MSSTERIELNSGDAVFFDGYSIHRGNYFANRWRRMLSILYGSPVNWFTRSKPSFLKFETLKYLSKQKRTFFQRLIDNSQIKQ